MTDPIQAFLTNGGFPAIADPRGDAIRHKAEHLTCVLIHTFLGRDADALDKVVPELLDAIISADEFGAGPLASLQLLGRTWQELVGVPTTFTPPEVGDDELLAGAAGLASLAVMPMVAAPIGAVQNPDVARGAIVMLATQLALRLAAAQSLAGRLDVEVQRFRTV